MLGCLGIPRGILGCWYMFGLCLLVFELHIEHSHEVLEAVVVVTAGNLSEKTISMPMVVEPVDMPSGCQPEEATGGNQWVCSKLFRKVAYEHDGANGGSVFAKSILLIG